eukprot:CAMPEP_0184682490 /NCGR_PEP_ID=MMETSP0312-20130426/7407_1 /TAXON_ID=31354 /ORGANISM="Compsopogon coeruleus, Strain SAG 36.94" /LENGTH=593 /DNA_ID=CAMNT_0027134185 /DNA_START=212 /DNA_END=1993 /DNA_ORIENTATION=-
MSVEDLGLLLRLPRRLSGWAQVRRLSWVRISGYLLRKYWVEIRGSALILYPSWATAALSRLSSIPSLSIETGALDAVLHTVPRQSLVLIELRGGKVDVRARTWGLKLANATDTVSYEVRFQNEEVMQAWAQLIRDFSAQPKVGLSFFDVVKPIGRGASGRVYLVRDKKTDEPLALKVIPKSSVYLSDEALRHAVDERLVMEMAASHPFVLGLRYAFQSSSCLFFAMEFCPGGDLFEYLRTRGKPLHERQARRLLAEVILAMRHIHGLGVIYRDLKLENVLIDASGHIRLADFGLSKLLGEGNWGPATGGQSFCGTREYVSPEMLAGSEYGRSIDYWACGILLYEMLCGKTPFFAPSREEVYERIESAPLKFPRHLSVEVVLLMRGLLDRNPLTRLGSGPGGAAEIMEHPFFATIDWTDLLRRAPHKDCLRVSVSSERKKISLEKDDIRFLQEGDADATSQGLGKNLRGFTFYGNEACALEETHSVDEVIEPVSICFSQEIASDSEMDPISYLLRPRSGRFRKIELLRRRAQGDTSPTRGKSSPGPSGKGFGTSHTNNSSTPTNSRHVRDEDGPSSKPRDFLPLLKLGLSVKST